MRGSRTPPEAVVEDAFSDRAKTSYAVRVGLFYSAIFLVYGVHVPFLPLWLDGQGLDANEVAIVTSAPFLFRLVVSPSTAALSDAIGDQRRVIIWLAWVGLAAVAGLGFTSGFPGILILSVSFALAATSMMPLIETIAVAGVRRHGLDYGRMRLWGSLTFIVIGMVAGRSVDLWGVEAIYWLLALAMLATVLAALALPRPLPANGTVARNPFAGLVGPEILSLVRSPLFLMFLVASSFTQAAHAVFYTFGVLHWQAEGLSAAATGGLWATGVLAEVWLFAVAGSRLRRVASETLLLAGAGAALIRWTAMAFDPPFEALIALQVLHALTFGATHLGAIQLISRLAPEGLAGTVQALYSTVALGIMLGLATLASGSLYEAFHGGAYLAMSGLSLIALIAAAGVSLLGARGREG